MSLRCGAMTSLPSPVASLSLPVQPLAQLKPSLRAQLHIARRCIAPGCARKRAVGRVAASCEAGGGPSDPARERSGWPLLLCLLTGDGAGNGKERTGDIRTAAFGLAATAPPHFG